MATINNVELVDLGKGKIEFRYKVLSDTILATGEEITTEKTGELFDGYIIVPIRTEKAVRAARMFGITIHNPDVIYRVRTVSIAITRLTGMFVRGIDPTLGSAKMVKGIRIHEKLGRGYVPKRVYRDGGVAIYPSSWAESLPERVGRELLPWYLGNRTRYFR